MTQIIVHTTENGNVALTIPTGELPINEVLEKDCPAHAIIVDDFELPEDRTYFNAWELINGKVVVNEIKKDAIIAAQQAPILAKQSAVNKLSLLGLTSKEINALVG